MPCRVTQNRMLTKAHRIARNDIFMAEKTVKSGTSVMTKVYGEMPAMVATPGATIAAMTQGTRAA